MTYQYSAIKVIQQPDAEPFFVLGVDADELLEWADVPRTKAAFMAGYQRELGDRVQGITEFIEQDPANVIPGAIIVALKEASFEIEETEGSDVVEITIRHDQAFSFEEQLESVHESFRSRLSPEELASISLEGAGSNDEKPDEDELVDVEDAVEDLLITPESYVAAITLELEAATKDFSSLPVDRRDAVQDYVKGVSKPGLVLDGQHRIFGAKDVNDFQVRMPVVLMPGLPMDEQVFHFFVLNNKARPLKPMELRRTISTALTMKEIDSLYDRFKQARLDAHEARWTFLMDTEPVSPFKGLIDFGLADGGGFIPENVADQVIRAFMKLSRRKYRLLISKVAEWDDQDYRLNMFFTMWTAIKNQYPGAWASAVDTQGGQMLRKVTLLVLQEYLLDAMNQSMPQRMAKEEESPLSDTEELSTFVKAALAFLKEEFFTRDWEKKQLDTTDGRRAFREQLQIAINNQSQNLGNMWLFRVS